MTCRQHSQHEQERGRDRQETQHYHSQHEQEQDARQTFTTVKSCCQHIHHRQEQDERQKISTQYSHVVSTVRMGKNKTTNKHLAQRTVRSSTSRHGLEQDERQAFNTHKLVTSPAVSIDKM